MAGTDDRPLRILQVVYDSYPAGIATWLVNVLRHIDRRRFRMDFLVHHSPGPSLDEAIGSLGSRVIPCNRPTRPWKYARQFAALLRANGPYDVVHGHVPFNGYVLRLARRAGVPVRIAHSHNDLPEFRPPDLLRRLFLAWTNPWIHRDATLGLACSGRAAAALFGPAWKADPRWQIHPCGIDLAPFRAEVDRARVRAEWHIPAEALVVGHVGRFNEQKNQGFLIDVAAEIARREPAVRLLLVGDGPLRPAVVARAAWLGLGDRVMFTGVRLDVARLLRGAFDVFVFPSRYEGLGMAALEAQAAGLPCVLSDHVPEDVDVIPALVRRLSLGQGPAAWAAAVLAARDQTAAVPAPAEALCTVADSMFNIQVEVKELERIYVTAVAAAFPDPGQKT
jgi:glycosyltransferase involved in cell wall biosynthesis